MEVLSIIGIFVGGFLTGFGLKGIIDIIKNK